ncbi:MAG: acyl-CoA thioesterase [Bacteroidales bacterium]|nr:acyl-CoA thioesterase [Bacteroidales bacterium]
MKIPIQLRFNDIDQMGHVNNAVIMEFLDLGKSEYFTAVGLPPEEGDFTVMVVRVEVDFTNQIRWHDKVHVETHVDHFGTKSLSVKQQVVNSDTGAVCATCRTVMSGYSRSSHTSAIIPNTIKEAILRYESGEPPLMNDGENPTMMV